MNLKAALKNILSDEELELLVRGYDMVGDIAITIIPPELEHREPLIGQAILSSNKNIRVVARRDGVYGGEYRTINLKVIAGENRKETVHREYGIVLHLNPEKVYFSVRSGSERKRVSDLVQPGEDILVMFSGVGPYPLLIARLNNSCTLTGIEANKEAHDFGVQNLKANKLQEQVTLYHGPVQEIVPQLDRVYDRIIMPLPKTSNEYLPLAIRNLKGGGWLHYYDFQSTESFEHSVENVRANCLSLERKLTQADIFVCGHSGPDTYRICVDALIA